MQERAQGNLNASIRERYYGALSSTPVTVLPLLMKLKNHHLAKLPNRGEAVNLEKLLGAKVFLELWVKVRSGWADDEARVKSFGYE